MASNKLFSFESNKLLFTQLPDGSRLGLLRPVGCKCFWLNLRAAIDLTQSNVLNMSMKVTRKTIVQLHPEDYLEDSCSASATHTSK